MILFFIGPPGSGKGTQAAIISNLVSMPFFSVGDILREISLQDGEDSGKIREILNSGKIVSSYLINSIIKNKLSGIDTMIVDGYPRDLDQAKFLIDNYRNSSKIVHFNINEELLIKRISGRFNCSSCGALYNSFFKAPKVNNICDECGLSAFVRREDDIEDLISVRLNLYKNEMSKIFEVCGDIILDIDASGSSQEVTMNILQTLDIKF